MATYANSGGTSGIAATGIPVRVVAEVVDFDSTTNAASDVFRVINVPANTVVVEAGVEVLTADTAGNSGTVALGDGTIVWVVAAAPTSTGQMTNANVAQIVKGTADTLDVTVGTGEINAKIRVWAILADLNVPKTAQVMTFTAV
jgi:cell division protein YceG involved in septum cleavage